ncbi:MAG TPA: response regulator [Chthoniobacteraceae bacterium]|nr:response regulator [Chthoniobacteraceae bacterium]
MRLSVYSGKSILVVDDDVVILRLVRESLTALLECEVDTTPNPEYAFELMLKKPYDLMIFDFSMPGIDGAILYSLISKVYETSPPAGRGKMPPLILMSGNAAQKRAQELLKEPGVRGLLAKPFSIEKLVARVSALLKE